MTRQGLDLIYWGAMSQVWANFRMMGPDPADLCCSWVSCRLVSLCQARRNTSPCRLVGASASCIQQGRQDLEALTCWSPEGCLCLVH